MNEQATTPPVLEAEGLAKTHRLGETEVPALRRASLRIDRREFCVLSGPSGSGKSTLLHLLGLLDRPDAGEIRMQGQRVAHGDERTLDRLRRDHLGFVFQQFNLVPVLSALENVELPLYESGLGARARREKAADLLAAVGLADRLGNRPHQLSGGQQQRVAIARALVRDPALVLADEPTANLDSRTSEALLDLLHSLQQRCATSFVVATHDPRVMARAQRVVRLVDGEIAS
jgi:putative ABC transport system ATP-binding protein